LMKSAGWIALCLVVAVSVGGWAQCGCGESEEPLCYATFQSNETIEFTLIAPVDYFVCHNTTASPGIWGWRVEASDGTVVRTVTYSDGPKSRLLVMEWDLYDDSGYLVDPGCYNVIVMSTDGDVSYPVRILERCRPCCGCFCWWYEPVVCDVPCRIPYGQLYLSLAVGETRPCFGLSIRFEFRFECSAP
jgi:hypothetical protein